MQSCIFLKISQIHFQKLVVYKKKTNHLLKEIYF